MKSDLISRKELIEEIKNFRCYLTGLRFGNDAIAKYAEEFRKSILRIIEEQPEINDDWIPVEERLPEEPPEYVDDEDNLEECIVMIDGAERPTTLRYAGDGTWWEDGTYYPVIAWRPLPEPYQPERSGE